MRQQINTCPRYELIFKLCIIILLIFGKDRIILNLQVENYETHHFSHIFSLNLEFVVCSISPLSKVRAMRKPPRPGVVFFRVTRRSEGL